MALLALGYFATAWAGHALAAGPAQPSPVWPAAGLAVGALLGGGIRLWPGVFVGVVLFEASLAPTLHGLGVASVIATGCTLQALLGAWLTRPLLRAGRLRDREVAVLLMLLGPVACLVGATVGLVRPLAGPGVAVGLPEQWLTWWSGDTLGVLLFAPIVICLWPGVPNCGGRTTPLFAVPLVFLAGLLVLVHTMVDRAEGAELREIASDHMDAVEDAVVPTVQAMMRPFFGVEGLLSASDEVSATHFDNLTSRVRRGGVQSLLWAPRVAASARAGFEALHGLRVVEVDGPTAAGVREVYFPVLFSVPADNRALPLGFDCGAEPGLCGNTGAGTEAWVAAPLRAGAEGRLLVPLVLPVFRATAGPGDDPAEARGALRGFLVGFYDVEVLFASLRSSAERAGFVYRVADVTVGSPPTTLIQAGAPDASVLTRGRDFLVGSRTWHLEIGLPDGRTLVPPASRQRAMLLLSVLFGYVGSFASLGIASRSATSAASERLTRGALDALSANIAVLDSRGVIVTTNRSWCDFAEQNGLAADAVGPGVDYLAACERARLAGDVDAGEVLGAIRDVIAGRTEEYIHDYTCHSPTEERWFCCRITRSDLDGEIRVVVAHEAITVVKRAQRAAWLAHRRSVDLFESSHDAIVMTDGRGIIVQANLQAELMFGWSRADLVGQPVEVLMPEGGRAAHVHHRARFHADPAPRVMGGTSRELFGQRKDGSTFPVEISLSPMESEGGATVAAAIRDVTERVAAQRALQESLDRYHGTLDAMMEGALILDFEWRCLYANEACIRHAGVAPAALRGHSLPEAIPGIQALPWFPALERSMRERTGQNREIRYVRPDGVVTWIRLSIQPVPEGLFVLSMDITDHVHAAEIQAEYQRELERERAALADRVRDRTAEISAANEELARARDAAEAATRAKSTFLATMSHEIRTPMNGVVGLIEVLTSSDLSPEHAEITRTIRESALSLLGVVDGILDFSKIEAGRLDLERTPVAITELVEGVCASLLPLAASAQVDVLLFVDPAVPFALWSDPTRLRQVLNNLLGNAIKFSRGAPSRRGRVWVRVDCPASTTLRLEVADNGIGMSEEVLAGLFEPFAQGEASTTRRFGGTGLGLVICKRLVSLMGGEITVSSAPGHGSTFTVQMPMSAAPAEVPPGEPDLSGVDCVVVAGPEDDSTHLHRYLQAAGCNVQRATSESEAAACAGMLDRPVVVHPPGIPALLGGGPRVGHVRVSMSLPGDMQVETGVVTVSGRAMRRSAFLRAVAVAAGREPGRSVPPTSRPAGAADVDNARAAGRLILVAEDDAVSRRVIQLQLGLLGYAAEFAVDGFDALTRWRAGGCGLLFTDLHMPGMDGYALAAAIRREEGEGPHMPILALTANALGGEVARALASGMQEYLTKPLQLDALRASLERWLPGS